MSFCATQEKNAYRLFESSHLIGKLWYPVQDVSKSDFKTLEVSSSLSVINPKKGPILQ